MNTRNGCETGGFIPLSEPNLCGNEWVYIKECLDTGWVSSVGSYVDRFERELARLVEAPHAVATPSRRRQERSRSRTER